MRKWPNTIPFDLRCGLERLLEFRSDPTVQDQWGVIVDWLNLHGVEAPDYELPIEPERTEQTGHQVLAEFHKSLARSHMGAPLPSTPCNTYTL